jgi:hypothetical protein
LFTARLSVGCLIVALRTQSALTDVAIADRRYSIQVTGSNPTGALLLVRDVTVPVRDTATPRRHTAPPANVSHPGTSPRVSQDMTITSAGTAYVVAPIRAADVRASA